MANNFNDEFFDYYKNRKNIDYYENRNDKNELFLSGLLVYDTKLCDFMYSTHGDIIYKNIIAVPRLRGNHIDYIPVQISKRMLREKGIDINSLSEGRFISIKGLLGEHTGHILDENNKIKNKKLVFAIARDIYLGFNPSKTTNNNVLLQGDICQPVIERTTPLGHFIAEVHLRNVLKAGERRFFNFIPCIAFDQIAENIPKERHTLLKTSGMITSRDYVTQEGKPGTAIELNIFNYQKLAGPKKF